MSKGKATFPIKEKMKGEGQIELVPVPKFLVREILKIRCHFKDIIESNFNVIATLYA